MRSSASVKFFFSCAAEVFRAPMRTPLSWAAKPDTSSLLLRAQAFAREAAGLPRIRHGLHFTAAGLHARPALPTSAGDYSFESRLASTPASLGAEDDGALVLLRVATCIEYGTAT